ncbi:sialic acid-binding Ig-like lectin 14 [Anabas testudineus]|uniref:sialic acid-binding Ig-like lectin 14 n=1 Tax=Anabas testudineus TaxID=64144 RepID=UPI000E455B46|nr:sialic acid-binding Ig-like lectin 14 [Anabas testudineus]
MLVLIWMSLVFCAKGTVVVKIKHCQTGSYCITLPEGEITAEAGLCVVLPCSFTNDAVFNVTGFIWHKCHSATNKRCDISGTGRLIFNSSSNENVEPEFRGRVSLLEPDVTKKNCSIIINDLRKSDSGSYELRLVRNRNGKTDGATFPSKAIITVTDLIQTPTVVIHPLTEGQHTTLTCTAPGLCSGSVPNITWMWRKPGESHITGNSIALRTENLTAIRQRHSSTLSFDRSAAQSGTKVTCKVTFTESINTEESLSVAMAHHGPSPVISVTIAVVSLIVNVIFIIYFLFLWNSRQKVKPGQEDRPHKSQHETNDLSVYANVDRPLG